jgi:nicotinate-nucleotide adenylyltransferase
MNDEQDIFEAAPTYKGKRYTAVFGGTFDPVHKAHIALAEKVLEQDLADEIMFVPAAKPPHKLEKPITPAEHRMAMLKLLLEEKTEYCVSDYEIVNKRKTSYTVNTLRALQAAYPERRFKLIMGMDNFREFDSWHRWQEILDNYEMIIFTRPGSSKLSVGLIQEKFGAKVAANLERSIIDDVVMDISSTQIRRKVHEGEEISDLVLPQIAEYIIENGLYV